MNYSLLVVISLPYSSSTHQLILRQAQDIILFPTRYTLHATRYSLPPMTIYIAADHAAFEMKNRIKAFLEKSGYTVQDFGPHKYNPDDDYPDFVIPAAKAVAKNKKSLGVVMGGSGIGECIAANKIKGNRAALCYDAYTAKMSREHNDANILCLGARTATKNWALTRRILKIWLTTPFSNEPRHARRLKKIE